MTKEKVKKSKSAEKEIKEALIDAIEKVFFQKDPLIAEKISKQIKKASEELSKKFQKAIKKNEKKVTKQALKLEKLSSKDGKKNIKENVVEVDKKKSHRLAQKAASSNGIKK